MKNVKQVSTEVSFKRLDTNEEVKVIIKFNDDSDEATVTFDFGDEGINAHKDGYHLELLSLFAKAIGIG